MNMRNFLSQCVKLMTYYMESSFELRNIRKLLPKFFLVEINIVTLKAFPPRKLSSKYTVPSLKYTKDILWAFVIVFISLLLLVIVNKT